MAGLLRAYVHHGHGRQGFLGHRFQGRFKSPAIQCEGYLLSCGRYFEGNPLEAGLVLAPWDYPWSSCRFYALGAADPLLAENPFYQELAKVPQRRRKLWQDFLLGEDSKEEELRRGDWVVEVEEFRRGALQELGRPGPRSRGRPKKSPGP